MTVVVQPTPVFNFLVTLIDADGPGVFDDRTADQVVGGLTSAALSLGSQLLFGGFSECQGLDAGLEMETHQEGGRNDGPLQFVKWAKYSNITLKRGITFNPGLWDWHQQVLAGREAQVRKDGLIILMDRGGMDPDPESEPNLVQVGLPFFDRIPVAGWWFSRGFPAQLTGPQLNATSNEIAIESLEIHHEGLARISLSLIPGAADLFGSVSSALGAIF